MAWTSWREGAAEVFVADADGGSARRLTWWGGARLPRLDAVGRRARPDRRPGSRSAGRPGRGTSRPTAAPRGGATTGRCPTWRCRPTRPGCCWPRPGRWSRRGGSATAAGRPRKLWWDADGTGEFVRLLAGIDAQLESPMQVGGPARVPVRPRGLGQPLLGRPGRAATCAATPTTAAPGAPAFYVRHASTDGTRVVFESAGELWILDSLETPSPAGSTSGSAAPAPPGSRTGSPRRRGCPAAVPDRTGRTSVVTVRGTVHRLTHRDGPARTLLAEPGVRARLAEPLGDDRAVWVDDADGEEAVTVAPVDPRADEAPRAGALPRRRAGCCSSPRPRTAAASPWRCTTAGCCSSTSRGDEAEVRELARGADGEISDLAWSPDSQWLAYADPVEAGISRIAVMRPADGVPVAVTEPRFVDRSPTFTARRPLPGLPVPAQLRPDLRPAFVRPDLPGLVAPVPRAAGRPHARPVRREPGRAAHLARRREGRRPARPRARRPVRGGRRERPEAGRRTRRRRTRRPRW